MSKSVRNAAIALVVSVGALLSVDATSEAKKPPIPCSIVLCPGPPTCAPGFVAAIPPGQCCFQCVPAPRGK